MALAEEGLTQSLDQLTAERLGIADDARERWYFHDGGLPLTFLFAGNWSVERGGATYLYRHHLYDRLPAVVGPEDLRRPFEVRFGADP